MLHSLTSFRASLPGAAFAETGDALVEAALAQAARSINETSWGDTALDGHALLTAHLLAMSPYGAPSGLRQGDAAKGTSTSVFWADYEDLRQRVGTAYRVVLE
jgi:hypothetical protein